MNKNQIIKRTSYTPTDLHVRESASGVESRSITGYAILFNTLSAPFYVDDEEEIREMVAPEAITKELLDGCDIKMTMFHNRELILARSKNGEGSLKYTVDDKGVSFEFEAPNTVDGDKALELVRRGDIAGCSFAFTTTYYDRSCVERKVERVDNKAYITYIVRSVSGVYDFTLAADPAYPDTSVEAEARELTNQLREEDNDKSVIEREEAEKQERIRKQVREMRRAAARKFV